MRLDYLLKCLFRCKSEKTSKFCFTGLPLREIHRGRINSPHKGQLLGDFPFDDAIMNPRAHGISQTKQRTARPCPYLAGYTVFVKTQRYRDMWQDICDLTKCYREDMSKLWHVDHSPERPQPITMFLDDTVHRCNEGTFMTFLLFIPVSFQSVIDV